jgi:AcrR family transcriptional regulator
MGSREEFVAAAAKVMREQGYAHATTKVIAQTAGYSEAMLYKHFRDKTELFLSVLGEELPALGDTLKRLTAHAADAPLEANLAELAEVALAFYLESFPIAISLFSSRELLAAHRKRLGDQGPAKPLKAVTAYLRAEARLGRISADTDFEAAASLLLGACFQQAFLWSFEDVEPSAAEVRKRGARLGKALGKGLVSVQGG